MNRILQRAFSILISLRGKKKSILATVISIQLILGLTIGLWYVSTGPLKKHINQKIYAKTQHLPISFGPIKHYIHGLQTDFIQFSGTNSISATDFKLHINILNLLFDGSEFQTLTGFSLENLKIDLKNLNELYPVVNLAKKNTPDSHGKPGSIDSKKVDLPDYFFGKISNFRLNFKSIKNPNLHLENLELTIVDKDKIALRAENKLFSVQLHLEKGKLKGSFTYFDDPSRNQPFLITWKPYRKTWKVNIEVHRLPNTATQILRFISNSFYGELDKPSSFLKGHFTFGDVKNGFQIASAQFETNDLFISSPQIASTKIGPTTGKLQFKGFWNHKKETLKLDSTILTLKHPGNPEDLGIEFRGRIIAKKILNQNTQQNKFTPNIWKYRGSFSIPKTSCQSIYSRIPNGLLLDTPLEWQGDVDINSVFHGSTANLSQTQFQFAKNQFDCKSHNWHSMYKASNLKKHFINSQSNIPLLPQKEINLKEHYGPWITKSILAFEDVSFYRHEGFDRNAIINALYKNLQSQKWVAGGSTISNQVAKNLFLSHERTLARKFKEMLLTIHLEQILPKNRILDIYLQIAEFGPNIYGVEHAARHFFNRSAKDLSLIQSSYLASILPSPIRRYQYFCNRYMPQSHRNFINRRLMKMVELRKISWRDFQNTTNRKFYFSQSRVASPELCNKITKKFNKKLNHSHRTYNPTPDYNY